MQEGKLVDVFTECNGCVFAEVSDSAQTGCKLGRLDKFPKMDGREGYFKFQRFCNTYRPESWLSDLSVSESEDITATALKEVQPRVGFFVIFDNNWENFEKTINCIKDQKIPARYIVTVNSKVEWNEQIHSFLCSNFDFRETEYHIVQIVKQPHLKDLLIDESFKHAKNGWAYVCNSGEDIDPEFISKVHKRINIDMKRLVIIKPYDDQLNGLVFQTALFKFLNGNHTKIFGDEIVDSRKFIEKIEESSAISDKDTCITWEEFNAA
jgi:hypothetical protein